MDREHLYSIMNGEGTTDYELYLDTRRLLSCQKPAAELCNRDELMFQIVHQVEEIWLKLLCYTLMDVDDRIRQEDTNRALTLFRRAHLIEHQMIDALGLLETMSPRDYQDIRRQLGIGSGQESPGFRALQQMWRPLWESFEERYLNGRGLDLETIFDTGYDHGDSYMVAEAMADFDELFQRFRFHHLQLVHRSIGAGATSLKGHSVEVLEQGMEQKFFPKLWEIRNRMSDAWSREHGGARCPLSGNR